MTILQCKYVTEIARTGSFSEAAKQLFVAQSSLSVSIKSLEQELNIQIFERSGNGVYLTDEGAEFIKYAKQICENNDFVLERYNSKQIQQKLPYLGLFEGLCLSRHRLHRTQRRRHACSGRQVCCP